MRVISISRLRDFWGNRAFADSEGPLRAWHTHVNSWTVDWQSWGDVKADYASASLVGRCVVFNIGGKKYRLITRILYAKHRVYILRVMTHAEYDEDKWKEECHCFEPTQGKKVGGSLAENKKRSSKPKRRKEIGK
jgi:mRNA interferase HigB